MMNRFQFVLALCVGAFGLAGCGTDRNAGQVTGKVTLDGEPIAEMGVVFQPANFQPKSGGGPDDRVGSGGHTDANGEYTLRFYDTDKPGALVGEHNIYLQATNLSSEEERDVIPTAPARRRPIRGAQQDAKDAKVEETPKGKVINTEAVRKEWYSGKLTRTVKEGENVINFELSKPE
jgi:hypothetical protein